MSEYELLAGQERFAEAMDAIGAASSVAMDTEFVRERTYFARLCLVQVAVPGHLLLIDPLSIEDPGPLVQLLRSRVTDKVFHAARQDIEVLMPLTAEPVSPLVDTQVAAGLLGFPAQIGYADLVYQVLGVELAKGHARTDWAARPLKEAQLSYAADDVRYLGGVADELLGRLSAAGRSHWLEEDCALLADPELYRVEAGEAWRRFKGLERMRPEEHAVVRALASWRETRAMRRNLPRAWVLADEAIRELARQRPGSMADLERVGAVPPSTRTRFGEELLDAIATARTEPVDELPVHERLTPGQLAQVKRLQEALQAAAAAERLSAEVLATRRELTALVRGADDVPALRGWRREVIGEKLLAAL